MSLAGISSMAMRGVLADLAEVWRRRSQQGVSIESVGGVEAARRVLAGEPFDFVVLAADALGALESSGRILAGSRTDLASSGIAVAVAKDRAHPGIGDEEAVRRAVRDARAVGYSTGPSGVYLIGLFARWGLADAATPRLVQAPPGTPVAALIARGDVDLGFQQTSELLGQPGIDVVGPLPAEIQAITIFSAAVCAASARPDAARELLAFLASRDADAVKRAHGMEPAS